MTRQKLRPQAAVASSVTASDPVHWEPTSDAPRPERAPLPSSGTGYGVCEVCGNDYDKSFRVLRDGRSHVFDCFECAIHSLAPSCSHCGCRILGHGMESDGEMYCCAHCAQARGVSGLKDRS